MNHAVLAEVVGRIAPQRLMSAPLYRTLKIHHCTWYRWCVC